MSVIVGAGGYVGCMWFGFLFKSNTITYLQAFQYIGYAVILVSLIVLVTKFAVTEKEVEVSAAELQTV